jgi:tRNA (guanosine-2'-O-)-methyltransferase
LTDSHLDEPQTASDSTLTAARQARIREVVDRRMRGVAVVLDSLYDPGNQAAVYRSVEAFGFLDCHVVNPAFAKKSNPRAVSRGAEKWLNMHIWQQAEEAIASLRASGHAIWVADVRNAVPLSQVRFDRKIALVFGAEHAGLSPAFRAAADGAFTVPTVGFVESLNISAAATATLAIARAQRERAIGARTDLTATERDDLYRDYCAR